MSRYFLVVLLATHSYCFAENLDGFDFSLSSQNGKPNGYLQTPAGGRPGSSSQNRPNFDELNINSIQDTALQLSYRRSAHQYLIGFEHLALKGKATLTQPLTSQNNQFAVDTTLSSKISFDWLTLGYQRQFDINIPSIKLSLGGDLLLMEFDNQIQSLNQLQPQSVNRSYRKGGYRLGGQIGYQLNQAFDVTAKAMIPLQLSSTADITTAEVLLNYRAAKSRFSGFAGFSLNKIRFKDSQTMPNSLKLDTGAMFKIGLSYHL